jgi:hypothetical protein
LSEVENIISKHNEGNECRLYLARPWSRDWAERSIGESLSLSLSLPPDQPYLKPCRQNLVLLKSEYMKNFD